MSGYIPPISVASGLYGHGAASATTIPLTRYGEEGAKGLFRVATESMLTIQNQSSHYLSMVSELVPTEFTTTNVLVGVGVGLGLAGVGGAIGYSILKDGPPTEDLEEPAQLEPMESLDDLSAQPPLETVPDGMPGVPIGTEPVPTPTGTQGVPEESDGAAEAPVPAPIPLLILRQGPRGRTLPSIAPYPLKVETFLRAFNIKHEVTFDVDIQEKIKDDPTKKPCIILDMDDIADSHGPIRFLSEQYGVEPRANLTRHERSLENAFSHLLDHHLYWGLALYRWVYDGARTVPQMQNVKAQAIEMLPKITRSVAKNAWFHGIGKLKPTEVIEDIIRDLRSLSMQLGDKKFFLNNNGPTELDCTAFGLLSQMVWTMPGTPFHKAVTETYPNLEGFCRFIKESYWVDWEECLWPAPPMSETEERPRPRPFRLIPSIPPYLEKRLNDLHALLEDQFKELHTTFARDLDTLHEVRTRGVELQHRVLDENFDRNSRILHEFLNKRIPSPPEPAPFPPRLRRSDPELF